MRAQRGDDVLDVSVLVATRDRADELARLLRELESQDTRGIAWELLVIDNGSVDATARVLEEARARLPLQALLEPTPGKNHALTRALPLARGRLLVFTDDDIVPSRTWLRTLHAATARWPDDSIFGGPILPKFPPNTPAWVRDPAFVHASIAYGRYEPGAAEGPVELAPFGANLGIRRDVFERYSFDRTIGPAGQQYAQGSEYELTRRLNLDGYRNVHVPSAPVEHVIRSDQVSVEWLLERAHRFGRGTERIHPSQQIPGVGTLPAALRIRWAIARCLRALSAPFPPRLRFALARHDAYLRGRADECARRAGGELRSPGSGYA